MYAKPNPAATGTQDYSKDIQRQPPCGKNKPRASKFIEFFFHYFHTLLRYKTAFSQSTAILLPGFHSYSANNRYRFSFLLIACVVTGYNTAAGEYVEQ